MKIQTNPPKPCPPVRSAYTCTSDQRFEERNSNTPPLHTNTVFGPPKLPPRDKRRSMNWFRDLESNCMDKSEVMILIQEHNYNCQK